MYDSRRYKEQTPEQRLCRLERSRLHDVTPVQLESKRDYKRRRKECLKNTLAQDSNVMENPKFFLEFQPKNGDAYGSRGSTISTDNWLIPELKGSPVYIQSRSEPIEDVGLVCPDHRESRRHVAHGERQSLLNRRVKQFEASISRKATVPPNDSDRVTEDISNREQQTQSCVTNSSEKIDLALTHRTPQNPVEA